MVGNLVAKVEKFTSGESNAEVAAHPASLSPASPPIRVELSPEQVNAILQQWRTMSAQQSVVFALYAGSHAIGEMVVDGTQIQEIAAGTGTSSP